ncbi:MAG: serine hydrolase [Fimbriimonadaceae bacterium]|nr:serine hydrolase [Fimbriimonadaceae bacterium]
MLALLPALFVIVAPPAQVPWTEEQVARGVAGLDGWAQEALDKDYAPGLAIVVVKGDQIIYQKGFGVRSTKTSQKVDVNTVFQFASVSKSVSGTLMAALVGDKKLKWLDPVAPMLPGFKLGDPWTTQHVTVRDLFSHQSGLADHAGDLLEDYGWDQAAIFQRLHFFADPSHFRDNYEYTNFGLTVAGEGVARKFKMTYDQLAQTRLFKPAGMNTSSFLFSDFIKRPNHADLHQRVGGKWQPNDVRDPDAQAPAGGYSGSILDLAQYLKLHLNKGMVDGKRVIDEEALASSLVPAIVSGRSPSDGRPNFYAMGMGVSYRPDGRIYYTHSGAFDTGARSAISICVSDGLAIGVVCNAYNGVPEAIIQYFDETIASGKASREWFTFMNGAFQQMEDKMKEGQPDFSKPAQPFVAAKSLDVYVGEYKNDCYGKVRIVRSGNGLELVIGPQGRRFQLTHYSADTFTYMTPGENSIGIGGVVFVMGGVGKASQLTMLPLRESSLGVFKR